MRVPALDRSGDMLYLFVGLYSTNFQGIFGRQYRPVSPLTPRQQEYCSPRDDVHLLMQPSFWPMYTDLETNNHEPHRIAMMQKAAAGSLLSCFYARTRTNFVTQTILSYT
jgi:hypothetical protein